jgi:hypothetical protein
VIDMFSTKACAELGAGLLFLSPWAAARLAEFAARSAVAA